MSDLVIFAFGKRQVRTAGTFEAPLFCAADVCEVLGYSDVSQACERLDQDEVSQIGAENGSRRVLYAGPEIKAHVIEIAQTGVKVAKISTSWSEWRAHMDTIYRDAPLQLSMMRPVRRVTGKNDTGKGAA